MTTTETSAAPVPTEPTEPRPRRDPWPRMVRPAALVAAGALTGLSLQPTALWPLAILGPALFLCLLHPASGAPTHVAGDRWFRRRGIGPGYFFGLGLCGVSLNWLEVLLPGSGPLIAAVLIVFEALFFALLGVGVRLVQSLQWWPVAAAAVWGSVEWIYGHVPFGGFGWVRLAYASPDSPLAGWLPFVSVSGVSFLTVLLAGWVVWGVSSSRWRSLGGRSVRRIAAALLVLVVVLGVGQWGTTWRPEKPGGDVLHVGMVQGNVDGVGIGGMGRARSVTNNHLSETVTLMAHARAGAYAMPDFVLWPENSTDIDPTTDPETHRTVAAASAVARVPIFVGAVMDGPGDNERQTSGLWWMPDNAIAGRYDKRNLVPFGEYVPFRAQLEPLIPILSLVGAQSVPGTTRGPLDVPLADGRRIRVGDVICFEVAYDDTVHDAVRGADVVVVQSNNATYRGTAQPRQQWAMTRVRAMEARRDIVVATTNSLSGHIDALGQVDERTHEMVAASNTYAVPRQSALTPAVRYAGVVDLGVGALAVVAITSVVRGKLRRRYGTDRPDEG